MIEKVIVRNYQSHKKTAIDLSPGINIFTGMSDSGKSAFIRAMRWVYSNRPLGDGNMSRWADAFSCSIFTKEGIKITRKRNNKFNGYLVGEEKYDGMSADVPEQVVKALNMNDMNFQHQFDNHFLLSSTPGAIAEYLNTVVDLQVIDNSIAKVNKKVREIERAIKDKEAKVKKLEESIEDLKYLDDAEELMAGLNKLKKIVERDSEKADELEKLVTNIKDLSYLLKNEKDYETGLLHLDSLLELVKQTDRLEERHDDILNLVESCDESQELLDDRCDYSEALLTIEVAEDLQKCSNEYTERLNSIEELYNEIQSLDKHIEHINLGLKTLQDKLNEYDIDVCPFCGQEIEEDKI